MAYVNPNIIERPLGPVDIIDDGEKASAAVFNRPIIDLRDNQINQKHTIDEIASVLAETNTDLDTFTEIASQLELFQFSGIEGNVGLTDETIVVGDGVTTVFAAAFSSSSIGIYVEGIKIDPYFIDLQWSDGPTNEVGSAVEFINGYTPAEGDSISLVSYGGADVYNKSQTDARIAIDIASSTNNYKNISITTNAVSLDYLFCNTGSGAFSVTLPSTPAMGDIVTIKDSVGNFSTANVTVVRNGSTIRGVSADLVLSTNWQNIELVYTGTDWVY